MRKPKPIGPLSSLPPEAKALLRQWLDAFSYEKLRDKIALPAPDGFGIEVSVWQLRRYFKRLALDHSPRASVGSIEVSSIIDQAALGKTDFPESTLRLLEKRAYELAVSSADMRSIARVVNILLKSRDMKVRERMVDVQKRKLALRTGAASPKVDGSSIAPLPAAPVRILPNSSEIDNVEL